MLNYNSYSVILSHAELKALANGKFQTRKCTHCYGKGWFWVHEDGTQRDPNSYDNVEDFYEHPCGEDECGGLGFNLQFNDEDLEAYEN